MEQNNMWMNARDKLYDLWKSSYNLDFTIRLGAECWYILIEWEFIEKDNLNYVFFQDTLRAVTYFGLKKFKNENKFLTVFGYMISTFPFLFSNDENLEEEGRDILKKAYMKNSDDLVTKALYLGTTNKILEYKQAIKDTLTKYDMNGIFNGNTAIEKYFREVIFSYDNVNIS